MARSDNQDLSDRELLAQGDFDVVFLRRWNPVVNLARRVVFDHHEAQDIAAEAFTRLWQLPELLADSALPWLRTTVRREAIRRRAKRSRLVHDDEFLEGLAGTFRVDDDVELEVTLDFLEVTLGPTLGPRLVQAVRYYLGGATWKEAAQAMDIPEGTLNKTKFTANQKLSIKDVWRACDG